MRIMVEPFSIQTAKLKKGYNCVGNVWIGDARIEAVFDTGATRNSIDESLLNPLVEHDRTKHAVHDVANIQPQPC